MRLTKHALSTIAVLVIGLSLVLPVSAQGTPPPGDYARIAQQNGLTSVSSVPAGMQPLKVGSTQEFQAVINRLNQASQPLTVNYQLPRTLALPRYSTLGVPAFSTLTRECTRPYTPATFYTQADIRVGVDGSFRWIDKVQNTRTGLSGIVATATLSNAYSYVRSQTTTRVEITGGGTVSAYIQTPWGQIYLWSEPTSCTINFSVY